MNKKRVLWALISLGIAGLTIWAVASQNKNFSIESFWQFVQESNKIGLLGALLCMLGFIWFEGLAIIRLLKSLGYKRKVYKGLVYGGADVYFSSITPSASGGQPASAYFMMKDQIPGTVVTVTLLTNLIMYTLALLGLGLLCILSKFDVFMNFSTISKVFIMIGVLILLLLVAAFYLLLKNAKVLYGMCNAFLRLLERMHFLKNGDFVRQKLLNAMEEYSACARVVHGKKGMLWEAFFWNVCQRLSQFGVVLMVFLAHGEGAVKSWNALFTQCFVALGSNCVPIPGSMGVADYLMIDGYSQMMPEETAIMMELLCRSIYFYGCILVSCLIVLIALLLQKIRGKKC